MALTASLFPVWTPELGASGMPYSDRYNVVFVGEIIVERSRDPETELARALLDRGHTGTVSMLDGLTGKPRTLSTLRRPPRCAPWRPAHIRVSDALRHVQRARQRLKRQ